MDDDEWGPCTSREEWLLMYERGLSSERIAEICRVNIWSVRRITNGKDRKDPEFFHRRLAVHDQPSIPKVRPRLSWSEYYANLLEFFSSTGRLPRQHGSAWERQCHSFLYKMRRQHAADGLMPEQVQLLERIDGWYSPPRPSNHWERRLAAYSEFLQGYGRRPRVDTEKGSEERSLAIWMNSQRDLQARGTLRRDRAAILNEKVAGWLPDG